MQKTRVSSGFLRIFLSEHFSATHQSMCSNDTRPVETVAEKRYFQSVLALRDGVSMKLGIISIRQIGGKRVGVRYV